MRQPGAREADHVDQHRKAAAAAARRALVVLGREVHGELAHVRITQRVVREPLGHVLENHDSTGLPGGAFEHALSYHNLPPPSFGYPPSSRLIRIQRFRIQKLKSS
jgi:hypothetical protein